MIDDPGAARTQIVAVLRKHLQIELGHVLKAIDEKRVVLERPLFAREEALERNNLPEILAAAKP